MHNRQVQNIVGGGLNGKIFHQIISLENLFGAWKEFRRGKRNKKDVAAFEFNLEDNLFVLHKSLADKTHQSDQYNSFYVRDPKLRLIHKASVRDRVLHQAIFRALYPIFDRRFIFDSYSCRKKKGTHRGVNRLGQFMRQVSANYHFVTYALKCDIRKFFDSINQDILKKIIYRKVLDPEMRWLVDKIIDSFSRTNCPTQGIPLGNVTSQLFANIYLNEFDQFVKHQLKQKYYLRYCDDFVILARDRGKLLTLLSAMQNFLFANLGLVIHPNKIDLRKINSGVDFVGYISLPHYTVLRTKTRHRIIKKLENQSDHEWREKVWPAYLGIIKHCRGFKVLKQMLECQ